MLESSDNQMRILPRIFLMLSLLATCLVPLKVADAQGRPESARISLVDRIAAVVNSEIITQFEWRERLARVRKDLQARNTPLPEGVDLERQVLERMIMERVQLQFAKEGGIRVEDVQLDQSIARIAESNSLSLIQFRQALERDGIPFDKFREEVRSEIILARVREREVDTRITVSDSEVDIMLSEQKEAPAGAAEYRLAHILLRLPDQASPEPEALTGGDLGWRTQDRLPDLFVSALDKMKPGEVSEVLRSPAGFHVLMLFEQRGAGAPFMVEQNRVRHILIRTSDLVSEAEARRKLANIRERIVNGVDFAELARTNSDDGSAASGGDLGWIYPGDTVPEFERVMRELKVGELSEPTRSPFGWHLIQVVARRTADRSDDRKRLEARRVLREKKSGEAYQEWLRQLRDRAYVEYRFEDR